MRKYHAALIVVVLLLGTYAVAFGQEPNRVSSTDFTCLDLDGSYVFSQESTPIYLGFFGNQFASESIMNELGQYGSEISTLSVRNEIGKYGSPVSTYSANNNITSTPPGIFKNNSLIAYLTTNTIIVGGVSLATIDASCTFFSSSPVTDTSPPAAFSLSVQKSGDGSGGVSSSPGGINCGATCTAEYSEGSVVTLTVTSDVDSTFTGWSGACIGTTVCRITMDSDKTVTAEYKKDDDLPGGDLSRTYIPVAIR
jgi:hypothetical protein